MKISNNKISNFSNLVWNKVEKKPRPQFMNDVKILDYKDFKNIIFDKKKINVIIKDLYKGNIFIIKKAFTKKFISKLKKDFLHFTKNNKNQFFKMKENCPNFHRIIDKEVNKLYSIKAIKHSAYFFHWNGDPYKIFSKINSRWRYLKVLGGRKYNEFEKNTPKDGIVDRIQILKYPKGGSLELHSDPYHNQRMFISVYMSKKVDDFGSGGFFALNKKKQEIDLEDKIDIGDIGIGYATVKHGVKKIDKNNLKKNTSNCRWFMGLYSNDSDEKKNRITARSIKKN